MTRWLICLDKRLLRTNKLPFLTPAALCISNVVCNLELYYICSISSVIALITCEVKVGLRHLGHSRCPGLTGHRLQAVQIVYSICNSQHATHQMRHDVIKSETYYNNSRPNIFDRGFLVCREIKEGCEPLNYRVGIT